MDIIKNFIVFEGADGSGTTTQLNLLADRLKNTGNTKIFTTFEPTSGEIGLLIRKALKKEVIFNPQTLCYLFAADRYEHLYAKDGIIEQTKKGKLVLCDRFVLSSLAYQGIECENNLSKLPKVLNFSFPFPEITLFFDIKPEIAMERIKNRSSHEIYEYLDFQKKVYEKYLFEIQPYIKYETARIEFIDASKSIEEVAEQVWNIIQSLDP